MIGFRYGWAPAASADDGPIQDGTFQFAEPAGLIEWLLGAWW